ncbi:MAG: hypothetical protein U0572_01150 [Phycisphaerales bacterium]
MKCQDERSAAGPQSRDRRAVLAEPDQTRQRNPLRRRLHQSAKTLGGDLRRTILGGETIPPAWVDARNHYTHWDEASRGDALEGQAMHDANVRLRALLRTLHLKAMGIGDDSILNALQRHGDVARSLQFVNIMQRRARDPQDMSGAIMTITRSDPPPTSPPAE